MKKITLKQVLIPLITIATILFLWFGPIHLGFLELIISSIVVFIGSAIEYKRKWFSALGFQQEKLKFKNFFVLAPLTALGLFIFYVFVLVPGVTKLTGVPIDYSFFKEITKDLKTFLISLVLILIGSGFGEEIIFRGYFMRQFLKFFGDSKISVALSIVLITAFFGFMYSGQGITGQIVTFVIGSLIAYIFYLRKYDLWFVCSVHCFFNTIALTCMYFGLA
ncbi:CPBP family glutamic-type intramembrane protease [Aquimarina sp. ERC-38]|uniref:CPBP family intramembrane glutamic endopeptidase n=1 Tax=Aquimarina sp. ERC-38 TaxID=2949996 RepID=UPI0022465048|nr:CPBP family intramembrane glutamic endopeptidase [Aquimarina sp. ERC-38]UZO79766.1 CPBP family glutamic-type intramembrane protease [Aquimarina sp. ERC-38]